MSANTFAWDHGDNEPVFPETHHAGAFAMTLLRGQGGRRSESVSASVQVAPTSLSRNGYGPSGPPSQSGPCRPVSPLLAPHPVRPVRPALSVCDEQQGRRDTGFRLRGGMLGWVISSTRSKRNLQEPAGTLKEPTGTWSGNRLDPVRNPVWFGRMSKPNAHVQHTA